MGVSVIAPYLGSDVTVLHLLLVFRGLVIQCVTARCGLWFAFVEFLLRTGEQAYIFLFKRAISVLFYVVATSTRIPTR